MKIYYIQLINLVGFFFGFAFFYLMKKLYLLPFLLLICVYSFGQTKTKINQIHQSFLDATVKADSTILDQLCHKNLEYGHSSASIEGKESFIKGLISGFGSYPFMNSTDRHITIYNKTAIVREKLVTRYISKTGAITDLNLTVIYVWVKEHRRWQLIQRQACKIPVN